MSDSNSNNDNGDNKGTDRGKGSRRTVLRYLVAGGTVGTGAALVPITWTKPIVTTVVLPAHAQTSVVPFTGAGHVEEVALNDQIRDSDESSFQQFVERVRSAVLSDAHALVEFIPPLSCVAIDVANLLDEGSDASVTLTSNTFGTDSGDGTLGALQNGGIDTNDGHTVRATTLNPDGSGAGTVDGIPFTLSGGACVPEDSDGESGPIRRI